MARVIYEGPLPAGDRGARHTLRAMTWLTKAYASEPQVEAAALEAAKGAKDRIELAERVRSWVEREIRYQLDPPGNEQVCIPRVTLELGYGDCDDQSVLVAAMLHRLGVPWSEIAFVLVATDRGNFSHVVAALKVNGAWLPLETIGLATVGREYPFGAWPELYQRTEIHPLEGGNEGRSRKMACTACKVQQGLGSLSAPLEVAAALSLYQRERTPANARAIKRTLQKHGYQISGLGFLATALAVAGPVMQATGSMGTAGQVASGGILSAVGDFFGGIFGGGVKVGAAPCKRGQVMIEGESYDTDSMTDVTGAPLAYYGCGEIGKHDSYTFMHDHERFSPSRGKPYPSGICGTIDPRFGMILGTFKNGMRGWGNHHLDHAQNVAKSDTDKARNIAAWSAANVYYKHLERTRRVRVPFLDGRNGGGPNNAPCAYTKVMAAVEKHVDQLTPQDWEALIKWEAVPEWLARERGGIAAGGATSMGASVGASLASKDAFTLALEAALGTEAAKQALGPSVDPELVRTILLGQQQPANNPNAPAPTQTYAPAQTRSNTTVQTNAPAEKSSSSASKLAIGATIASVALTAASLFLKR